MQQKNNQDTAVNLQKLRVRNLLLVYFLFSLSIFILPVFSFQGYSLLRNTTSHLGAQGSPNAFLMNMMFMLIAVFTFLALRKVYENHPFQFITLFVFTLSMIMVGIFPHEPLVPIEANIVLADLHSFFASTAGVSFTLLAASTALISKKYIEKSTAVTVAVVSTLLSIGMFSFPPIMGLLQRLIFITSYGWLLYISYAKIPR